MEETYGLVIKRKKEEIYGFPMPLKEIDKLTTTYSENELLKQIEEANIIPNLKESNPEFAIAIKKNNKWLVVKKTPIITDSFIINYNPLDVIKTNPLYYMSFLYSSLNYYLQKDYPKETFKKAINSLKSTFQDFSNNYQNLSYEEKRIIKCELANKFDIKQILINNETLKLTKEEELK